MFQHGLCCSRRSQMEWPTGSRPCCTCPALPASLPSVSSEWPLQTPRQSFWSYAGAPSIQTAWRCSRQGLLPDWQSLSITPVQDNWRVIVQNSLISFFIFMFMFISCSFFCHFWDEITSALKSGFIVICYITGNQNSILIHVIQRRTFFNS